MPIMKDKMSLIAAVVLSLGMVPSAYGLESQDPSTE